MNTRKYSKEQEKQIGKVLGGKVQSNSGATMFKKGDVVAGTFLIEAKTMTEERKSFTVKKEVVEKLKKEAFAMGKPNWAMVFNFGGLGNKENYYIISEWLFLQLKDFLEGNE